jgi:hypothetical protein
MLLLAAAAIALLQIALAATAPARFIIVSLWIQTIPLSWTWNLATIFDTPLGPINVLAFQVFALCVASLIVLFNSGANAFGYLRRFRWHAVFLLFCCLSIAYAPSLSYGFRTISKLAGPMLFMLAALVAIDSSAEIDGVRRAVIGSGLVLMAMAITARILGISTDPNAAQSGMMALGPPGMGPAVFSAHMLPVAMLVFAMLVEKRKPAILMLCGLCTICLLGAFQRTSAAALFAGYALILFLGTRGFLRYVLPTCGLASLPALLIFDATFRRRMFFSNTSSSDLLHDPLSAVQGINSSGRFALWKDMLARFYAPHPILGSGLGATQDFLYGRSTTGQGVVHSEYVRVLCEVGVVGLVLFALAGLQYLATLFRLSTAATGNVDRTYALAAAGAVLAYLMYMATDNSFDYVNQLGAYVFALVAMAIKAQELGAGERIPAPAAELEVRPLNLMA